jgi:hypothetical protein
MVALRKTVSEAEYLERDRTSAVKLERVAGEIFALAGAKVSHNLISGNVVTILNLLICARVIAGFTQTLLRWTA